MIVIELKALLRDAVPELFAFFKKPLVIEAPEVKRPLGILCPGLPWFIPVSHKNLLIYAKGQRLRVKGRIKDAPVGLFLLPFSPFSVSSVVKYVLGNVRKLKGGVLQEAGLR